MSRPNTPTYKTLNWPAYNEALERRGSLTIWFDAGMAGAAKPTGKRGRRSRPASGGDSPPTATLLSRPA